MEAARPPEGEMPPQDFVRLKREYVAACERLLEAEAPTLMDACLDLCKFSLFDSAYGFPGPIYRFAFTG